jgi:RNA polymerase sigma-70 factor (ECF subfamily)
MRRFRMGFPGSSPERAWSHGSGSARDRADPVGARYRVWWPVVVDYAARRLRNLEEAEVVAQEALLRALAVEAREPVMSFAALVLRIAHHLCVDHLRRGHWRTERADLDSLSSAPREDGADLGRLRQAVDTLPPDLLEIVERRYVDGQSFAEIAEQLSMSKNGVFARHRRALDQLRRVLAPEAISDPDPRRRT